MNQERDLGSVLRSLLPERLKYRDLELNEDIILDLEEDNEEAHIEVLENLSQRGVFKKSV